MQSQRPCDGRRTGGVANNGTNAGCMARWISHPRMQAVRNFFTGGVQHQRVAEAEDDGAISGLRSTRRARFGSAAQPAAGDAR